MSQALRPELELTCSQCGQPEAFAFDEPLCAACYHARGSCGAVRESESPGDVIEHKPRGAATRVTVE